VSTETISEFGVTAEFIKENAETVQARKKGGPYSKQDRLARRNEVFRLHFEYGYSAVKIADIMKVNRNTITSDISYLYSQATKRWKSIDPSDWIIRYLERLDVQRSRLREEMDKTKNFQEKLGIERLILDVESKILQTQLKMLESVRQNHSLSIKWLNDWMKKNKYKDRYISYYDVCSVSEKSREKINKIIKDDKKN
jgi:hypothetical protein